MAIEVRAHRRSGIRLRANMGERYAYYEWDFAVYEEANARHAFRKFRRDLLAKGLMDAARLADGGYAFVARMYPAGEEV